MEVNAECVGPESEQAGKAASCEGCPNQQNCKDKTPNPALAEVAERLSEIKHKLLVLSGKGGVGKSTFAAQLAWSLSDMSKQTGILDIDICGPSVPRMMGVENEEVRKSNFGWSPVYASDNLAVMSVGFMLPNRSDAIIWRGPRKTGLIQQFLTEVNWGDLDFLVVDAPPGTSDEHISIAEFLNKSSDAAVPVADRNYGAVILTTPQEVALLDVRKEISFCKKVGIPIYGVVENMSGFVCPCCKVKSDIFVPVSGGAAKMAEEMGVPFLGAIPLDPKLVVCCERGESFCSKFPESPAAVEFQKVVRALLDSTAALRKDSQPAASAGASPEASDAPMQN